jgi:Methyltransferase domain
MAKLAADDLVLDVGGWAKPFARADWVIDLMPYETRGLYDYEPDPDKERFRTETWVQRDICDRQPWPFAKDQFDFAVCSQTLEDVRDPVWVCSEMIRVARAGYIEVPSRLEEQTFGIQGPWVGWGHHRWLVDVGEARIDFTFKHHVLHGRSSDHFPARLWSALSAEERVDTLWWKGTFEYGERILMDSEGVDRYLGDFVAEVRAQRAEARHKPRWRLW